VEAVAGTNAARREVRFSVGAGQPN